MRNTINMPAALPPSLSRALPLLRDAARARADVEALLAPTEAGGFRVYLDDACAMPADWRSRLHVGLNASCRSCPEDHKYGAESALPHMLASSPFVTSDWRRANASLVVLYAHRYGGPLLGPERCRRRLMQHSPAWRHTGGRRHFFVVTSDFGPCDHNGHFLFPELLKHHMLATHGEVDGHHWHWGIGPNLPCFSEHKDISIPPANWLQSPLEGGGENGGVSSRCLQGGGGSTGPAAAPSMAAAAVAPAAARGKDLLAFFAGAGEFRNGKRQGRQLMLRIWGNRTDPAIWAVPKVPRDELRKGMARAKFCPIFGGNSPWSTRLVEAINCGCVPVFFSSWRPPFSRLLDWERFSVRVPSLDEVPRLKEILEAQNYEQLAANLPLSLGALWYRVHGGYRGDDVLPYVLVEMQMALRAAEKRPLEALAEEAIGLLLSHAWFDDDRRNNRSLPPAAVAGLPRLPPVINHAVARAHAAFPASYRGGVTIVTNRSSWPSAVVWRCVPIATHAHSYHTTDPLDVGGAIGDAEAAQVDQDLARLIMANCLVVHPKGQLTRERLDQIIDPLSSTQMPRNYSLVRENRLHFLKCRGYC